MFRSRATYLANRAAHELERIFGHDELMASPHAALILREMLVLVHQDIGIRFVCVCVCVCVCCERVCVVRGCVL